METILTLELPYPPSVNRYYRNVGARTLISREGRAYREAVGALLAPRVRQPMAGPLEIQVDLFPPDRRRRDIDNAQKAVWDSLQHGGVYLDDSQIVRAVIEKRDVVPGGKVLVRLSAYPDAPASSLPAGCDRGRLPVSAAARRKSRHRLPDRLR